tara:strand:- start:329 stop:1909 length:1581 start_codon:yes stop_codon:yes gene_type:complete
MAQRKLIETRGTHAEEFAKEQKHISISEFFTKNRHLLGFDNPSRALLMTVKEAVDNSLDACADMHVLPELYIELQQLSEKRMKVIIEDNGPGIVKEQVPNIFARLLYGSKFHKLKMSRGQQGIGISASVLYSQLTTGKSTKITSKISPRKPAHHFELQIDTKTNEPKVLRDHEVEWNGRKHGTRIELELEGKYQKGKQSVDEYIKQTAIVNPHAQITYITPDKKKYEFPRATKALPIEAKEIKPHPHGIELGMLISMLQSTTSSTVQSFLQNDFCRVGAGTAKKVCQEAKVYERARPKRIAHQEAEKLFEALQKARVIAPPTDCLSPIGPELLEKGLKKEVDAEFYISVTRPPTVYRGFPFQVEVGLAYGGSLEKDGPVRLMRFANRVPLLYQQGACAIAKSSGDINWRAYGLSQSGRNLPQGPMVLVVHMASVWVPFTSEAKDAVAHYDAIMKEIRLGVQEAGRKLGMFIRKRRNAEMESKKRSYIEKYLPHIGIGLKEILDLSDKQEKKMLVVLKDTLERSRKP